jgi:hypothetical protein
VGKYTSKMLVLRMIRALLKKGAHVPHASTGLVKRTCDTFTCPKKCSLESLSANITFTTSSL